MGLPIEIDDVSAVFGPIAATRAAQAPDRVLVAGVELEDVRLSGRLDEIAYADVEHCTVHRMEQGKRRCPRPRMSRAVDVEMRDLHIRERRAKHLRHRATTAIRDLG